MHVWQNGNVYSMSFQSVCFIFPFVFRFALTSIHAEFMLCHSVCSRSFSNVCLCTRTDRERWKQKPKKKNKITSIFLLTLWNGIEFEEFDFYNFSIIRILFFFCCWIKWMWIGFHFNIIQWNLLLLYIRKSVAIFIEKMQKK